jgi:hypothetical protein
MELAICNFSFLPFSLENTKRKKKQNCLENRYLGFHISFLLLLASSRQRKEKIPRKIGFLLNHFFLLSLGYQNEQPIVSLEHSLCRERERKRERGRATERARDGERERERERV